MGISIVVTSGKGGTGKTSVLCGVATCLASMGYRVLCLDLDVGLRNLDLTLGMSDRVMMDFSDVIRKNCTLAQAVSEHPLIDRLFLLAAPLRARSADFSQEEMRSLIREIKASFDFCLIDSPAGIDYGFELACCGADRAIVVTTTEPASLRDAQQAVAQLRRKRIPIHLIVNKISRKLLRKLHTNIDDAMDAAGLPLLGIVPEDDMVPVCAGLGQPLILYQRRGAALAFRNIAKRLTGRRVSLPRY